MTNTDSEIEMGPNQIIVKAIAECEGFDDDDPMVFDPEGFAVTAQHIIYCLEANGYVIAPKETNIEMCKAADFAAYEFGFQEMGWTELNYLWKSMISTLQKDESK